MNYLFIVLHKEASQRLDIYLIGKNLPLSRSQIKKLVEEGKITVNEEIVKAGYKLHQNDSIKIEISPPAPIDIIGENIPLDIIYEDDSLIVVNKPSGMVVHPAAGNYTGTLVHALLFHCRNLSGIGGVKRPGIVHRLDKNTSGVMVVAKDDKAHWDLSKQFKEHTIERGYLALVWGIMEKREGKIDIPIGRHINDRKKISPKTKKGRIATTNFRVKKDCKEFSLLEIRPETGRTHQIRVHLAHIKHPIVGDPDYGGKKESKVRDPALKEKIRRLQGQALHAYLLGIVHPYTGEKMKFKVPMPTDMREVLNCLDMLDS